MRLSARALSLTLVYLLVGLAPALAPEVSLADEGEPAAPADTPPAAPKAEPKPDPDIPTYSIEFLMPGEKEDPQDWKLVDADRAPSSAPTEDELAAIAEGLGLDDETFYVETTALKKGDDVVGVAMTDVDKNVHAFLDAVKAKAGAKGWRLLELGSPARLMILGGAAGSLEAAESAMREHIVYAMSEMAMERLRGKGGWEAAGQTAAAEYRNAIKRMVGEAGVIHALQGVADWVEARRAFRKPGKNRKLDKKLNNKAADAFSKALAEGTPYPPKKTVLIFVSKELGSILLQRKDKAVLAEATRALEIAVENEEDARKQDTRYSNRYNLACAYALAGKTDKALDALRRALEAMKSLAERPARSSWEHIERDKDMNSIRGDPRFSKLMSDYEPKKPMHWDRDKAEREKRRKQHEKEQGN